VVSEPLRLGEGRFRAVTVWLLSKGLFAEPWHFTFAGRPVWRRDQALRMGKLTLRALISRVSLMSPASEPTEPGALDPQRVYSRVSRRLIPFLFLCYIGPNIPVWAKRAGLPPGASLCIIGGGLFFAAALIPGCTRPPGRNPPVRQPILKGVQEP